VPRAPQTVVAVVAALVALAGATWVAPPVAAEATGGCRPIGGSATASGGPNRATVIVDPGSGPVWSACISFRGTISGLDALELAVATIPGLDPVYEPYPGQGRAVCRLLGVGNDPPNCLSRTVAYWSYFRNGAYSRGGGGGSQVGDGDVEGWSFSAGTAPRAATHGTEAVPADAVPITAPPTTAPSTTAPPAPAPTEPVPVGPAPGATAPAPGPGVSAPGPATTGTTAADPGASGPDAGGAPSTTLGSALGPATDAGGDPTPPDDPGSADGTASPAGGTVTVAQAADSGSSLGSVLGFGSALGALGVAAVVVRRRRDGHGPLHAPSHATPLLEDG
jgi:hypothetical protein